MIRGVILALVVCAPGAAWAERLFPGNFVPQRYAIELDVSLRAARFSGRVRIEGRLDKPTATIVLHAADMRIRSARAGKAKARVAMDAGAQTATLKFPAELPAGPAALEIQYDAKVSDTMRALYKVKVGRETFASTQLENTDARRLFPCVDEPSAKAKFQLTVSVDRPDVVAVSNTEPLEVTRRGGKRVFRFAETPRLSTYLVALSIAPYVARSATTQAGTKITAYTMPDKIALADYALRTAVEVLPRLEAYFGIPYPYKKLDLVAVPEFEAGAMENAGAIFFRESALLVDPRAGSEDQRRWVAAVVTHEMAHQWFGDLVTLAWWDDVWLNEAFASFMEYRILAGLHPEWNLWTDFEQAKRRPMALDALPTARPIRARAETPGEIDEMFDATSYWKGQSVLRMLELYLGEDAFRDGIRLYLSRHREGNATSEDLWRALAEASGKPADRIAPGWIDQPGYPLLRVTPRAVEGTLRVTLEQERHLARRPLAPPAETWQVPVCLKYYAGKDRPLRVHCDLLSTPRAEWTLEGAAEAGWLHANAGQGGYYRVRLDPAWLQKLAAQLAVLLPEERLGLIEDQWALVQSGDASAPDYLALLEAFRGERSRAVLEAISKVLVLIRDRAVPPAAIPDFEKWVAATFGPTLAVLDAEPAPGTTPPGSADERGLARAAMVKLLGYGARAPEVLDRADAAAARYLHDAASVEANVAPRALELAALRGGAKLYDAYFAAMKKARSPEERENYLDALAAFDDPALVQRTLDAALGPDVRKQDASRLIGFAVANPAGHAVGWAFVQKRFSDIAARVTAYNLGRVIAGVAIAACDPARRREAEAFFAAHPMDETKREVAQALQAMDLCLEVRSREEARIAAFLAGRAQGR